MLYIGEADGRDKGVFTSNSMRGEIVFVFGGKRMNLESIPRWLWRRCLQLSFNDRYVMPEKGVLDWFLNRSYQPSCVVNGKERIVRGEETAIDYSTIEYDSYRMRCKCGSKLYRGLARLYSRLTEAMKRRYGKNVLSSLLQGAEQ